MTITLKTEATCRDCGAILPAGSKARWFRNGDVYGNDCHRWKVAGLSPRRIQGLAVAVQGVLAASRGPQAVPGTAEASMAGLFARHGGAITAKTYKTLMADLQTIEKELKHAS